MAPEIIINKGYGRNADIWSLGCVVIEMAVGGNPYGENAFTSLYDAFIKIVNNNISPKIPDNLSDNCKDFILKCLNRDRESRPTA